MSYKKIQLIHVAKKQLGIDESLYRLLLVRVTGLSSLKDLNSTQLDSVISELKRLGFKGKSSKAELRLSTRVNSLIMEPVSE